MDPHNSIAHYLQSPFVLITPELASPPCPSVKLLVDEFSNLLKKSTLSTPNPEFSQRFQLDEFKSLLEKYIDLFQKNCCYKTNFGFIEKHQLESFEHPQIYVRADLHGDLKSLIENLKVLQNEGLLGENFDCPPGVHLVFLGDYCDRGFYGTEILQILMLLQVENPTQVHLIRGNHEDISINIVYSRTDKNLQKVLADPETRTLLTEFYETMPLSIYVCMNDEKKEYVQFTHGLFEISLDPSPLLDSDQSDGYLLVPKKRMLSERVRKLSDSPSHSLKSAAKRISDIFAQTKFEGIEDELTAYNWADVTPGKSSFTKLNEREYKVNAEDIKAYLTVSSDKHTVELVLRGHQHTFSELSFDNKVITTTLTVGADVHYYRVNDFDKAYLLKPQKKVAEWGKRSIIRIRQSDESVIHQEGSLLHKDHPVVKAGDKPAFYLGEQ